MAASSVSVPVSGGSRRVAFVQGVVGIASFFLLWYLLVDKFGFWRFKQLPKLVPSVREWLSPNPTYGVSIFTHEYYVHLIASTERVLFAFVAASLIGITVGILCGWSRLIRAAIFPLLEIARPIPVLAWIPVVVLLAPTRNFAVVTLTFLAAFFITTLNTLLGVKSIDEVYFRAARSLGFSEWAILRHVIVPGALPYIFIGLQIAIAACWFSLVASEIVAGANGLGYKVWESYYTVQFETMVAMMATLGLCGYISSALVRALGRFLTRWRNSSMRNV
ncbi:MAG: ABC transporter permease [Bradyrhizobiaceae bacterium]|nr:MAG: ABC transporter permease [Bradyrhizobiaceae bacterium]